MSYPNKKCFFLLGYPTPLKLNMEPENQPLEKEIPWKPIIFRFHVKLWEGTWTFTEPRGRSMKFPLPRLPFSTWIKALSRALALWLSPFATFEMSQPLDRGAHGKWCISIPECTECTAHMYQIFQSYNIFIFRYAYVHITYLRCISYIFI